ncbi:MAG TPA: carbamoyltransferase HypF [Steroidobacteraceae bacterium]|nr:carbamoyltransferase HypF [Steroidobacteraceae bacterium]
MNATWPLTAQLAARRWRIGGRVQGVGFRPFVYRLAISCGVAGWVRNHGGVVEVLAEGGGAQLRQFGAALLAQAPPAARPELLDTQPARLAGRSGFVIRSSRGAARSAVHVPPDLFACAECLQELHDPRARRHRYPFINCTQCGPRYTLIRALPYDRPNTTMAPFVLCPECQAEYADPLDRRFHAQPLACPRCGPQLQWQPRSGGPAAQGEAALAACLAALAAGQIVAARGIGGYHLLCDARNAQAIAELRRRKHRPAKPLALMLPRRGADGLDAVREMVEISAAEAELLRDPARPIVLLSRRAAAALPETLAPGLRELGVMLPYSPLHELLLEGFAGPLVATSGNLSGEPVLTDVLEAHARLASVADGFLDHDRPIARPADDPVYRRIAGRPRALRLGRGTAPLELRLASALALPTLAVGAHLKNTVALGWEDRVVVSPHVGDLDSPRALTVFTQVAAELQSLYGVRAQQLVQDAHPGFASSRWARQQDLPSLAVWHHHAHASALAGEYAALAGECAAREPLLCFTWDGVGLGADGTLWGAEALLGTPGQWRRVGSLRAFRLPGGEQAARAPWRSALGLCWSSAQRWPAGEVNLDPLLREAFERGLNCPWTSAAGRLFDAAAALLGICREASHEAEAPMRLEALAAQHRGGATALELPLLRDASGVWRSDCASLVPLLLDEQCPPAQRAACFHESLAAALCRQAEQIRADSGARRVGLCGGVFQNRLLAESAMQRLIGAGFEVLLPERLPANDAAISFGQVVEAAGVRLGAA